MDLDSPAGTVLVSAVVLVLLGLAVTAVASTRAAPLLGMHQDGPSWFSPRGGRTQGLVLSYLAGAVAVGALVFLVVAAAVPDGGPLAWTCAWASVAVVVAVTVARFGKLVLSVATGGRALLGDPAPEDFVDPDDALDDLDVRAARDAASRGEWRPAAHLLAATEDPDVRHHRTEVLAQAALRRRAWLDAWLREEPGSAVAHTVHASLLAQHAWELRGADFEPREVERFLSALDDAEASARHAVTLDAADPGPHAVLVAIARGQQVGHDELERRLADLLALAPRHLGGHEAALQFRCAKWFGSEDEMFAHARAGSALARPGDALALLVVTAHLEHALALGMRSEKAAARHWAAAETRAEIADAVARWRGTDGPSPVGAVQGHNLLAFTAWLADDADAAAEHLAVTRRHLATWPWAVAGDPSEVHAVVQQWARQTTRPKAAVAS